MIKAYTKKELIEKFAQPLGIDKATSLIEETLHKLNLHKKPYYHKGDLIRIARVLRGAGGFVSILANCLASEAYRMGDPSGS